MNFSLWITAVLLALEASSVAARKNVINLLTTLFKAAELPSLSAVCSSADYLTVSLKYNVEITPGNQAHSIVWLESGHHFSACLLDSL